MLCRACGEFGESPVCPDCRRGLRPAPAASLPGGLVVRSAFLHEGPGARLVHRLKYEAVGGVAEILAEAMIPLLPTDSRVLVPIPRSALRRIRYGVDPGVALATAMARRTGLPAAWLLVPELFHRPNAGRAREARRPPVMRSRGGLPNGAVLVDDVLTTGSTLRAASQAVGDTTLMALTATRAMGVLARPPP